MQAEKKPGRNFVSTAPRIDRRPKIVVGIGEILWDIIGSEKHLGGAPTNFAYHASALGDVGVPVSRVGSDELGSETLASAKALGIRTEYIQIDRFLPTGTATVALDAAGQPRFEISRGVAWDNLVASRRLLQLARRADAVCFGTLAQRSTASRRAIRMFLEAAPQALLVCDLNLRAEFAEQHSEGISLPVLVGATAQSRHCANAKRRPCGNVATVSEIIVDSIRSADVLKLNEGELCRLKVLFGHRGASDQFLLWLIREFELRMVCVTRGARGCVLRTMRRRVVSHGVRVRVVDTVGCGDAFTAALVHHMLRRRSLRETAAFANRVGAYVASQPGATPLMPARFWQLDL